MAPIIVCENIRFSSLFVAEDVSRETDVFAGYTHQSWPKLAKKNCPIDVKTLSSGSRTICSTTNVNNYLKRKVKNTCFSIVKQWAAQWNVHTM